MTICKVTGMACDCQPDEGVECTGEQTLREGFHGWRNAALKAEARVRELEITAAQAVEALAPSDEQIELQRKASQLLLFATGAAGSIDERKPALVAAMLGCALSHLQWACETLLAEHRSGDSYEVSMLRNLLARIHGDGGHYADEHGLDKALEEADSLVAGWRAAPPAVLVEPAGWKLVPLEPTEEMLKAASETPGMKSVDGILALHQLRTGVRADFSGEGSPLAQAWRAMLAARPLGASPPPANTSCTSEPNASGRSPDAVDVEPADPQVERALCALVAEGETVQWYLEQAFLDDSAEVRGIMVREIVRMILGSTK